LSKNACKVGNPLNPQTTFKKRKKKSLSKKTCKVKNPFNELT